MSAENPKPIMNAATRLGIAGILYLSVSACDLIDNPQTSTPDAKDDFSTVLQRSPILSPEELFQYQTDIEATAKKFIKPAYFPNGVNLSLPASKNHGMVTYYEESDKDGLLVVETTIQAGRNGRQPFVIRNGYLPHRIIDRVEISSGSPSTSFLRPDLIPTPSIQTGPTAYLERVFNLPGVEKWGKPISQLPRNTNKWIFNSEDGLTYTLSVRNEPLVVTLAARYPRLN